MNLRIGLDLDDSCNFWYSIYLKKFGEPKDQYQITKNVQRKLTKDRAFWLSLPIKHKPDFDVTLYCTKRVNKKAWTRKWLELNDFPKAPIYQVYNQGKNKADVIKGRVDVFVDDSVANYLAMNRAGVPCLLIDSEMNRDYNSPVRIYSLSYVEIEAAYKKLINEAVY